MMILICPVSRLLIECEFVGCGMGYNKDLFPYYMIIEKAKEPILKAIGKHCREE
jgi:hypothetical protein